MANNQRQETQQEREARQLAEQARARAEAVERELAASRAMEEERRRSLAPITEALPRAELARLGAPEEQATRERIARDLMTEQQAGQRQLLAQQAKQGVRGGAAAAQQSQLAQRIAAQRSAQEQGAMVQQRMFNIEQAQKEQFANIASELARRQLMTSLRGQDVSAEAARQFGAQQLQAAQSSGGGGTVICTELYQQGLMDQQTFEADQKFGKLVSQHNPYVMIGYWTLAVPVVKLMRKSYAVTKLVNLFAAPWAKEMASRVNPSLPGDRFGAVIMFVGVGLCGFLGRIRVRIKAYGTN